MVMMFDDDGDDEDVGGDVDDGDDDVGVDVGVDVDDGDVVGSHDDDVDVDVDVDVDGDGDGDGDDDYDVALRSLCFAFPGLQLTIVSQNHGAIPVLHVHRGACSCASSWCAWTLGKNGRAAVNHIHLSKTAFKNEPKHAFKNEPKHAFKNDHLPIRLGV